MLTIGTLLHKMRRQGDKKLLRIRANFTGAAKNCLNPVLPIKSWKLGMVWEIGDFSLLQWPKRSVYQSKLALKSQKCLDIVFSSFNLYKPQYEFESSKSSYVHMPVFGA